jgi:cobyrinic acid a,c-diamide synthase
VQQGDHLEGRKKRMPRIVIAGTHTGCGKTTVSCALLAAFKARGVPIIAFKCGPDYIDPMFHRAVTEVPSYNLDPFFLNGADMRVQVVTKMRQRSMGTLEKPTLAVLEGAMGYYDGIGASCEASSYIVARDTKTPVILVVDLHAMGHSVFAVIEGFVRHQTDSGIYGIIGNGLSESRYLHYKPEIEKRGLKALGYLPHTQAWRIESRHLGLTTAAEIPLLQEKLVTLGRQAAETIDLDGVLALAHEAQDLTIEAVTRAPKTIRNQKVRLAVARDESFCFLYQENLELLEDLGCDISFFSPLHDAALPEGSCGLVLCGGYPELYAASLAKNVRMRTAVKSAILGFLPTIAECGGFLYLHTLLDGLPMAGVLAARAFKTEQLQRFGYVTLTAKKDTMLCNAGDSIRAHEFHYWESTDPGCDFTAQKSNGTAYPCIHATDQLYMGFPHLYFPANPDFAARFVQQMYAYHAYKEHE